MDAGYQVEALDLENDWRIVVSEKADGKKASGLKMSKDERPERKPMDIRPPSTLMRSRRGIILDG